MPSHKKYISLRSALAIVAAILVVGGILRYQWIVRAHPWQTVEEFQERYIYSDMRSYWAGAAKFWSPDTRWTYGDLIYPPGTGTFFALVLGPEMKRVVLWQTVQWLQSMWILVGTSALAFVLYGRRAGLITLSLAALAFPLFDYGAYMLSETPFTSTLLGAVLCTALAIKRKQSRYLFFAGMLFALSATFKSVGLLTGFLLFPILLLPLGDRRLLVRVQSTGLLCAGLISILLPVSLVMTERNGGQFMLLSHDVLRIAIANHGRILGIEASFPDGGWFTVTSPVSLQKNFQEIRTIHVGQDDVIAENLAWMRSHPLQAATDMVGRMTDMVYGTVPFPTGASSFRSLVSLSQLMMLFFVYLPAVAWAAALRKRFSRHERLMSCLLLLPLLSLLATGVIAATEPRYLHPFAPFLIVCASLWYKQVFALREFEFFRTQPRSASEAYGRERKVLVEC